MRIVVPSLEILAPLASLVNLADYHKRTFWTNRKVEPYDVSKHDQIDFVDHLGGNGVIEGKVFITLAKSILDWFRRGF